MEEGETLADIMRDILRAADGDKISLGDIVQTFETRGFGPLLFVPSLILVLPTGAIPGMPVVCGLLMIFITAQLALGYKVPWIPHRLKRMRFDGSILRNGVNKVIPWVERLDRLIRPRFSLLVSAPFQRLIGLYCLMIALLIIPLGAIPFAIFPPSPPRLALPAASFGWHKASFAHPSAKSLRRTIVYKF